MIEHRSGHKLREKDDKIKCVDCWEVRDTKKEFDSMECKSFRYKGQPSTKTINSSDSSS